MRYRMLFAFSTAFAAGSTLANSMQFDVMGGYSTASILDDSARYTGRLLSVGAMIAPVSMVPVGIGVFAKNGELSGTTDYDSKTALSSNVAGVQISAWAPTPLIEPYVKAAYDLYGRSQSKESGDDYSYKTKGKLTGYSGAFGALWQVAPTIGVFAQFDMARETYTPEDWTMDSTDDHGMTISESGSFDGDPSDKAEILSRTFQMGLAIGF